MLYGRILVLEQFGGFIDCCYNVIGFWWGFSDFFVLSGIQCDLYYLTFIIQISDAMLY